MKLIKICIMAITIIFLTAGIASANPFSLGILQRAEVNQGITLGGNLGIGTWPGSWLGFGLGITGEYGFSGEETKNAFSLNNLAAGFSITHDRTAMIGDEYLGQEYSWRWNNFKFGPYAKYEILDPEKSVDILGDWAQFYLSVAAGFKINISSPSIDWEEYGKSQYLERGPYSNTFMADLLILADFRLSNVVESGFFNNVTLTLGTGLANNRFAASIVAWYDTDLFSVSLGYRPLLGTEIGIIIPLN